MASQTFSSILSGHKASDAWGKDLALKTQEFYHVTKSHPTLAVIRVGKKPASLLYIKHKKLVAQKLGFHFKEYAFSSDDSISDVMTCIQKLNMDRAISGIITQLPLPPSWDRERVLSTTMPQKDVDGLHPLNRGKLFASTPSGFVPCTPLGCLKLLNFYGFSLVAKKAVIVGRSDLVGKPLLALLLQQDATVTIAHSKTPNLPEITRQADFLFVATGKPLLIEKKHVTPETVVIDVGFTQAKQGVQGDTNFEELKDYVKAITPVPGGVGPMTVMGLMYNTLKAAYTQCQLLPPAF